MSAEEIPQDAVEHVAHLLQTRIILNEYDARVEAEAIVTALHGLGYHLETRRDD